MKIQSPWMGRIKGSAGNMTGCKMHDKNVMRAKAFEVNNPNTAAQQVQRGYFADLTKLVAGFTPDQLRTLFPSKPKAMSRRNALAKQLAEYNTMENNEKVVDYAHIDTLGNAPTKVLPVLEVVDINEDVSFTFVPSESLKVDGAYTIPVIVAINVTKKEIAIALSDESSESGNATIPNTMNWVSTDNIDGFLLLTNTRKTTTSFGSFIIKVRPEKKSN